MLLLTFNFLFLAGCGSSKTPVSEADWQMMEQLVTDRNFKFSANSMQAGGAATLNRVEYLGFLGMQRDQVAMALPYLGSNEVGVTHTPYYGTTDGMHFEGMASDIKTSRNDKNKSYDLDFTLKNKAEVLDCNLRVFTGKRAVLSINSSRRPSIRYDGTIIVNPQDYGIVLKSE